MEVSRSVMATCGTAHCPQVASPARPVTSCGELWRGGPQLGYFRETLAQTRMGIHTNTCITAHTSTQTHTHVGTHMHTRTHIHMHAQTYAHTNGLTRTHTDGCALRTNTCRIAHLQRTHMLLHTQCTCTGRHIHKSKHAISCHSS